MEILTLPCPTGLEPVLAEELVELGLPTGTCLRGAVRLRADREAAYRALLGSRVASRVLLQVAFGPSRDARQLYDTVRSVPWVEHLGATQTLAVDFVGTNPELRHSGFSARCVKDAICDELRDRTGARPSVDLQDPDLRVHVYLDVDRCRVSLDLSGPPLHLRSGGVQGGVAPLKENLAAALLRIAGWPAAARAGAPLVDPMCGTGTLLREGAAMARGDAPGLARSRWGFSGWAQHDQALWQRLVTEARERPPRPVPPIVGSDRDGTALGLAREGLAALGLQDCVRLDKLPLEQARPPDGPPGLVVTNAPYGARLGDEAEATATMRALGDVLRQHFLGWHAWVLAGSPALARQLGLRPAKRHEIWNGRIDCRWLDVPISAAPVQG